MVLMFISASLIRRRFVLVPLTTEISELVDSVASAHHIPIPNKFLLSIDAPNAFVFGSLVGKKNLVLTKGLLETLNETELEAAIHHELSHVRNKDVAFLTWTVFSMNCLIVWFGLSLVINLVLALLQGYSNMIALTAAAGQPIELSSLFCGLSSSLV